MPTHHSEGEKPPSAAHVPPKFRMRRAEMLGVILLASIPAGAASGLLTPDEGSALALIARVALLYGALILGFRVLGKRELSQLSPFELVTLLLVAEIVSPALSAGDQSVQGAIIGSATLLTLTFLNSAMTYRWRWFRRLGEAPPAVIIHRGQLHEDVLHKDRLRPDEILSEMRKAGLECISQVKWGVIEPDGRLTFIPYGEAQNGADNDNAIG